MLKKTIFAFLSLAALTCQPLRADEAAPTVEKAAEKAASIREILYPDAPVADEKDFAAILQKARGQGATGQQLLEAEAFRGVVHGFGSDFSALAARLEKALENWDAAAAFTLPDKNVGAALVYVLRGRAALAKNDEAGFRVEAGRALWLEPKLSELIAKIRRDALDAKTDNDAALDKAIAAGDEAAIRKAFEATLWQETTLARASTLGKVASWRETKKTANLVLPLDVKFERVGGEPVSLGELLKDKKGALLDFHASWCGPCIQLLPDLPKKAEALNPQGIVVLAFNVQNAADAKVIQERFKFTLPVLVEKDGIYSRALDVDSIPRYVLVGADGKIYFNGHPGEAGKLDAALAALGVKK